DSDSDSESDSDNEADNGSNDNHGGKDGKSHGEGHHGQGLPDTGNTSNGTLIGSLFAALGSLFLVGQRRKKHNEK
ncbi:MAG: LPXTG cell wall anchor domain-containing protein, partial [Staphylococcus rostri]|uniref:LPXTG cell wall anchor domain-containing protein n=1 Tax=Staphylococcus rostri TaxID=522262 RepID=UPI0026DF9420